MDLPGDVSDTDLFVSIAASIPGYIFRFRRSSEGVETLDYVSPGFDEIWQLEEGENRNDPSVHWSRVLEADIAAFQASIEQALISGAWDFRYRIRIPGGGLKWLHGRGKVRITNDAEFVIDGMILDVTEQVAMERSLEETKERLAQAYKMEAVGKLTAGVAHDFNNLLAVILGNLELMDFAADPEDFRDMQAQAIAAVTRGKTLTSSMLSFARKSPLAPQRTDMLAALQAARHLLAPATFENIAVEIQVRDRPLWTVIDRTMFENAVLNIAVNARDAMPDGGALTIEAGHLAAAAPLPVLGGPPLSPGRYVEIVLRDTGVGIPEGDMEQVIEPFFTTKPPGKGSGLGLSMVHGFVTQSGGGMRIVSTPGAGTAIHLLLPEASEAEAWRADPGPPPARVLLVEDQDDVRTVMLRLLESLGYDVTAVGDAQAALDALRSTGPFAAAILDNYLGGALTGRALARQVRAMHPECRTLILTGVTEGLSEQDDSVGATDPILQKPVTRRVLQSALRGLLSPG